MKVTGRAYDNYGDLLPVQEQISKPLDGEGSMGPR